MSTTVPPLAVLGAGNMAGAVLRGLLAHPDVTVSSIWTTNRSRERAAGWASDPRVAAGAVEADPQANRAAVRGAQLIMIGVKPAQVLDLLDDIADAVDPAALVVSLAAGVSCAAMTERLPAGVAVIRTAANITSLVGLGVTGLASLPGSVSADQQALVDAIFATIGMVVPVAEDDLHAIAATSGSGPAYFYYLLERFTESAVHSGVAPEVADDLVRAMFIGAAELLRFTGHSPAELRRQVSSPKGSTERAIAVLAEADLTRTFHRAIEVAMARTREMGAAVSQPAQVQD